LVIQFLKHDAHIPNFELLPYKQPLVTLGKFFHHHPTPQPRSRALLVRWVWRGALNGAHRGDTVSTRNALERIVSTNEERSVQLMLEMVKESPKTMPEVEDAFNYRFAASKLLALALIDLGPRDLESGAPIDLGALLNTSDRNMALPRVIASIAGSHGGLVRSAANRLAHPQRAGIRRHLLEVTDPEILASHGISEEARQALRNGDAARFLSLRVAYLRPLFHRFFARHARWEEPDRPSLSSLLIPD